MLYRDRAIEVCFLRSELTYCRASEDEVDADIDV